MAEICIRSVKKNSIGKYLEIKRQAVEPSMLTEFIEE